MAVSRVEEEKPPMTSQATMANGGKDAMPPSLIQTGFQWDSFAYLSV